MIVRRSGEGGVPDGMTVTPLNSVETWVKCAGMSYTSLGRPTLAQVAANSTTCATLMASQNAVNYMIRSTAIQTAVLGSTTAVAALDANNPFVTPAMTSNTSPSPFVVTASAAAISGSTLYGAFGDTTSTGTAINQNLNAWLKIDMGSPIWVYRVRFAANEINNSSYQNQTHVGELSADNSTWKAAGTIAYGTYNPVSFVQSADAALYRYYRVRMSACQRVGGYSLRCVRAWGRKLVAV